MLRSLGTVVTLLAVISGINAIPAPPSESHRVTLINRCPTGDPVFLYRDNGSKMGSTTINGPLYGGVAWLDNYAGCEMSGRGCGTVEFSLISVGTDNANAFNSVNYSLLKGDALGNHDLKYPMSFQMDGACSAASPPCTSEASCPGAYVGTDTFSGKPVTCAGNNVGVTITFC